MVEAARMESEPNCGRYRILPLPEIWAAYP